MRCGKKAADRLFLALRRMRLLVWTGLFLWWPHVMGSTPVWSGWARVKGAVGQRRAEHGWHKDGGREAKWPPCTAPAPARAQNGKAVGRSIPHAPIRPRLVLFCSPDVMFAFFTAPTGASAPDVRTLAGLFLCASALCSGTSLHRLVRRGHSDLSARSDSLETMAGNATAVVFARGAAKSNHGHCLLCDAARFWAAPLPGP